MGTFLVLLFIAFCFIVFVRSISKNENHSPNTNSLYTHWGNYYKKKLALNTTERRLLNKISTSVTDDPFYKIDFCLENSIVILLSIYRSTPVLPPENYWLDLFKYCIYQLKRQYVLFLPVSLDELGEVNRIESVIDELAKREVLKGLLGLAKLTVEQEKKLYASDKKRWGIVIDDLKANYADSSLFYEEIKLMESINSSIVAKRNLYYESYSFMIDKDKVLALKFYLHYLHVGSESDTFKFRVITRQHQKKMFANDEQLKNFNELLRRYNKKKNLNDSLIDIEQLFIKKRKKIVLDEKAILSAKEDLNGVVDLLNEYFEDENYVGKEAFPIMEKLPAEASTVIIFNNIQSEFLNMFSRQFYSISLVDADAFANSKGVFKSQLIDGINDLCYDLLDDMLIEEGDGDNYILNEKYYKKIIEF